MGKDRLVYEIDTTRHDRFKMAIKKQELSSDREISKKSVLDGLVDSYILEVESHPSGKMFAAKSKLRKTIKK